MWVWFYAVFIPFFISLNIEPLDSRDAVVSKYLMDIIYLDGPSDPIIRQTIKGNFLQKKPLFIFCYIRDNLKNLTLFFLNQQFIAHFLYASYYTRKENFTRITLPN